MFVHNEVFAMASFKTTQDLICSSRTSNFIDDEKFFVLSHLFERKYTYFPYEIIQLSTWMRLPSPSVRQSLDFEKETFWCDSCFPYKVYLLYIKDIWFALPKYVQINLSQFTYEFARSAFSAVAILQSKINSLVEFSINIACLEKKGTIPGFRRTKKCKGLQKSLKTVDLYLPKLVDCRTTWFYFVWRRPRHHDDEIY